MTAYLKPPHSSLVIYVLRLTFYNYPMTRISSTFRRLGKAGEVAAIPYMPIGSPDVQTSRSLLPVIGRQGADLIAFGPLLTLPGLGNNRGGQHTGASLHDCIGIAAEARRTNEVPLILVSDLAAALAYGLVMLADACAGSGIDGLLIPDLPLEEFASFAAICAGAGTDPIPAVSVAIQDPAPLASAGGFVYFAPGSLSALDLDQVRTRILAAVPLPIVIGVAGDDPGMLPATLNAADGILAGSGLAKHLTAHPQDEIMLEVSDYIRALKEATTRVG